MASNPEGFSAPSPHFSALARRFLPAFVLELGPGCRYYGCSICMYVCIAVFAARNDPVHHVCTYRQRQYGGTLKYVPTDLALRKPPHSNVYLA